MARAVTAADCGTCGACCGPPYLATTYIDLTVLDLARLRPVERRRMVKGTRWARRKAARSALTTVHTDDGVVCVALRGRMGAGVSCAVYARRPEACRRFAPGSRACRAMRADVGIPDA
jgi:Fe-S-cluster containining protein